MKKSILFLLFFFPIFLFSQSQWERAAVVSKKINSAPLSDVHKEKYQRYILKDHQNLKECTTKKCKAMKHLRMASMHFVIDNPIDSISYNLDKLIQLDTARGCRLIIRFVKSSELPNLKHPKRLFFAKEFSKEWYDNFLNYCQPYLDTMNMDRKVRKKATEIISNLDFAEQLQAMEIKDQEFREALSDDVDNKILWKKQHANDLENRNQLDFLFKKYGYPTPAKVGSKGVHSAWLILQHSIDCDWNERWIQLHIDNYLIGEMPNEGMLPFTISRFFSPENGYCPKEQRETFIKYLKKKYSEDVVLKFGFKDF